MSTSPESVAITGSNYLMYKSGIERGQSEALLDVAQQFKRAALQYDQQLAALPAIDDPAAESLESQVARATLQELKRAFESYEPQLRDLGVSKGKGAQLLLGQGCKYIEAEKSAVRSAIPGIDAASGA